MKGGADRFGRNFEGGAGPCDEDTHSLDCSCVRKKVAARPHSGFEAQKCSHAIQVRLEFAPEGAIARR